MKQTLSKSEYFRKTAGKSLRSAWILFALTEVLNVVGLIYGWVSLLGLIVCAACGIGIKITLDKRWAIAMLVWGILQAFLVLFLGGFVAWGIILCSAIYFYKVLDNLEKSYAAYLKSGELPDLAGC